MKNNVTPIKKITPLENDFEWKNYPYPKRDKDGNITGAVAHVDNLKYLLDQYGIEARYNLISKEQELLFPDFGSNQSQDNEKGQKLELIKSLCEINKMPISRVQEQLVSIANVNHYNPVIDYCTQKEWDGIDRINAVLDTVVVDEKIEEWKNAAIVKFLMAAVCASINDKFKKFKFKSVLTFQGYQGIGKTPWIKILMGDLSEHLLQGHKLNPDNKDSIIAACKHWIVELGELDQTTKKSDVAGVKAVIDKFQDDIRLPYAAEISTWARRTVFFGTVNPASFLMDNTGNDRYWCIPVLELKLDDLEKIDMQQLWAQVFDMVQIDLNNNVREPWALTDKEKEHQSAINEAFRSFTPIEESIIEAFEGSKNEPLMWQASLLNICEALGFSKNKLTPKDKAAAEIMLDSMFKKGVYNGKRGYSIPHIKCTFENELAIIGMIRRAGRKASN